MSTTAQAFAPFLADITPTGHHLNTLVPARRKGVENTLGNAFPSTSDMPLSSVSLIGSAEKGTALRPVEDTDVLALFSNENDAYRKYRYDSQKFLYRIREAYADALIQQVGARGQAVRVFYKTGGHVDVAPVFFAGGDDYLLPAGDKGWIRTSPFKANQWFRSRNAALSYHLPPVVKLLKKWNSVHSRRLKSYHLETMAATAFSSLNTNYRDALAKFFSWASNHLDVQDPGGHSGNLAGHLSWSQRNEITQSFSAAQQRADSANAHEALGNHVEAKRLWSIILGSDFPG